MLFSRLARLTVPAQRLEDFRGRNIDLSHTIKPCVILVHRFSDHTEFFTSRLTLHFCFSSLTGCLRLPLDSSFWCYISLFKHFLVLLRCTSWIKLLDATMGRGRSVWTTSTLDRLFNLILAYSDRSRRLVNLTCLRGHIFEHIFIVFWLEHVPNSQTIHCIFFLLRQATPRCSWETIQISCIYWTIIALVDCTNIQRRWWDVFCLFGVFFCHWINSCFSLFVRIFVSVQNKPLFKLILLSLV